MGAVNPELSVVVVLHNSASALRECLRSLGIAAERVRVEVIAVDNASPDDSAEIVQREMPGATVIEVGENRGFAAGVNIGIARARGRYWLLLNPDVEVPSEGLRRLIDWMDGHPGVGLASPDLVDGDGTWQSPGRAEPSALRAVLEATRLHRLLPRDLRGRILRGSYWSGGDQLDADWVPGAAMMVRPDAAHMAGPLREDLFMYGEDIEWCWRLRQSGWSVGVCSETRFIHAESSSARMTWGEAEKERRMAAGVDQALRAIRSPLRARAFAAVYALVLTLEAASPGRTAEHRRQTRSLARIWFELSRRSPQGQRKDL